MASADILFQQALAAIDLQNRERAQELLAELMENHPRKPEYWLALSYTLDEKEEKRYCIQQALVLDPDHELALKMLADLDAPPPPPEEPPPPPKPKTPLEQAADLLQNPENRRWVLLGGGLLVGFILLVWGAVSLIGPRLQPDPGPGISYQPYPTATASPTFTPVPTATLRPGEPTPPWGVLAATYTPTPVYGATPHPLAEAYTIAQRRIEQGNWAEAISFLEQVVTAEPQAADALVQIGQMRLRLGQPDQALRAFEKSLAAHSGYAPAYLGRALARLALDDALDSALQDIEQAISIDPAYGEAHLEKANVLLQMNQPAAALEALSAAEESLPDSPLVPYYRGQAALMSDDPAAALALAEQALRMDLTMIPGYLLRARALQMQGEMLASLEPLEVYLRYTPAGQVEAAAHHAHALALIAHERLPEAVDALTRAVALDPADTTVLFTRADLYMRLGDAAAAEEDYRAVLNITPADFAARMGLARALREQGDRDGARKAYERAEQYAQTEADLALIFAERAECLQPVDPQAALLDWERLLQLPQETVPPDLLVQALAEIAALSPTVTP